MATSRLRSRLQPYLPRLTLEWLADDPERRHREVDGSVVFVDISGFTALSEKLATAGPGRAPRRWPTSIDACFGELLAVAYEGDGSLLKFGGDALLLLFSGGAPATTPRGPRGPRSRCALGSGPRASSSTRRRARSTLRMSVGVHTGRFDFFLVGGSHRELIVTGPAATRVVHDGGRGDRGRDRGEPRDGCAPTARVRRQPPKGGARCSALRPKACRESTGLGPARGATTSSSKRRVPLATRETLLAATRGARAPAGVGRLHPLRRTRHMAGARGRRAGRGRAGTARHRGPRRPSTSYGDLLPGVRRRCGRREARSSAAGVPRAVGEDEERLLLALRRIVARVRRHADADRRATAGPCSPATSAPRTGARTP